MQSQSLPRTMRRTPLLLALLAVGGLFGPAAAAPPAATQGTRGLLQEAHKLSESAETTEEYSQIIQICHEASQSSTDEKWRGYAKNLAAWAFNRRGEALDQQGYPKEAIEDFESAIRLDATRWRAWHNRGVSRAMQGDYRSAIDDFSRALKIKPNYANAYFNRAELLYELGELAAAIKDYDQTIRLARSDASAYNSRGHAKFLTGEHREALDDYSEAIRIDPQHAAAYVNRGELYFDLGEYQHAADDLRTAIRIDPESGRAYASAAWFMATCPDQRFRRPDLAVDAAQRAIDIDGTDGQYLETLAAALANAGQFDRASQIQRKALDVARGQQRENVQQRLALYEGQQAFRVGQPAQLADSPRVNNGVRQATGSEPIAPRGSGPGRRPARRR